METKRITDHGQVGLSLLSWLISAIYMIVLDERGVKVYPNPNEE